MLPHVHGLHNRLWPFHRICLFHSSTVSCYIIWHRFMVHVTCIFTSPFFASKVIPNRSPCSSLHFKTFTDETCLTFNTNNQNSYPLQSLLYFLSSQPANHSASICTSNCQPFPPLPTSRCLSFSLSYHLKRTEHSRFFWTVETALFAPVAHPLSLFLSGSNIITHFRASMLFGLFDCWLEKPLLI